MTVHVRSGPLRSVVRTGNSSPRPGARLARSRREYDARRRALIEDPSDRAAFKLMSALVKRDPCSLRIVPECHAQMAADHIVPLDRGGTNDAGNLTGACRACNAAKKKKSLLMALLDRKAA